jgi:two-component system, sensor histidine kinase
MSENSGKNNGEMAAVIKSREEREEMDNNVLNMINCPTILSGMSHEMRTHMNSVVAFSFLMSSETCSDKERKEFTNHILSSCEKLMVLFDNFLDSAIIDTGNSKAEPTSCNLGNIIDNLLSEFRVIMKREDLNDLVLIQENQASKNSDVCIDPNSISRVLRNLFLIAVSNTTSGYIKIGYYFRDGNATFYILDSGQGYEKCRDFLNADNLNEALRRYNDTYSAINLTLSRKLVMLMGGNIWVEKNGIAGTAMYISVPAREVATTHVSINKYSNTRIAI